MEIKRCTKCMEELGEGARVCPCCGYEQDGKDQPRNALKKNTILRGRYLVGNVIGQGGFGITYVGWDLTLEMKVAVKEYFPSGTASRTSSFSNQIQWDFADNEKDQWTAGMDRFLAEARKMAKLDAVPSVVRVRDAFRENQTAYIVMDFVEGETLKKHLMGHGVLRYEECMGLLSPILDSLAVIHDNGFIHRDISPDNIMLQPDGSARLLDMGAAVDVRTSNGYASMAVIKRNFSAPEQYMESEILGNWTDVYAMGATIYYCMTGHVVPEALEREFKKTPLSFEQDLDIPSHVTAALNDALALNAEKRIRDMREFKRRLTVLEDEAAGPLSMGNKNMGDKNGDSVKSNTIPVVAKTGGTEKPGMKAGQETLPAADGSCAKPVNKFAAACFVFGIGLVFSIISIGFMGTTDGGLFLMWIAGIAGDLAIYNAYKTEFKKMVKGLCATMAVSMLLGWVSVIPFAFLYIKLPGYRKKRQEWRQEGKPVPLRMKLVMTLCKIWLGIIVVLIPVGIYTRAGGRPASPAEEANAFQMTEDGKTAIPPDWIEDDFGYFTLNNDNTYTLERCILDTPHINMPGEFRGQPITEVGSYAFASETEVEQIRIPDSVRTIKEAAFDDCDSLKAVFLPSGIETVKEAVVKERAEDSPAITFFCGNSKSEIDRLDWCDGWEGSYDTNIIYENSVADTPDYRGWIMEENGWRYYEDGFIKFGWQQIAGRWYYLDDSGAAWRGWLYEDDNTYYFDENNCNRLTGWQQIEGEWYYFDIHDGYMLKNTVTPDGYRVNQDGACDDTENTVY